jgi:CubicO group peptidase (beta-lactamase class C family)
MRGFIGLFLALGLAGAPAATAADKAQAARIRELDAWIAKGVADWKVPGLSVTVVKDGQVVFGKGYGVRELGRPEPVSSRTLFAVGSTTKAMTAAAVGMLVDEGRLRWDDPVIRHLPGFLLSDPYLTREVTVRDLLTHRAGMPNTDFLWYRVEPAPGELLRRLAFARPETSLRSHFTYQNVMYHAAGELVTAVGGKPWAEFVKERIFDPLGMTDTLATSAGLDGRADVARPHFETDGRVEKIRLASVDAIPSAGAVWSSSDEMARWLAFLLAGGKQGGQALLSETTLAELFRPQMLIRDGFYPSARLTKPHWTSYGLGWFQQDYDGRALDFHTGSIDGMVAICGLVRDEQLGVVVLANLDHAELRHAIMLRVLDAFGRGARRDWSAELLSTPRRARSGRSSRKRACPARARAWRPRPSPAATRIRCTAASR